MKVCLVGSSGGHLAHLYMLKKFWHDKERFWVTFDKEDARSLLKDEKMYSCYYPTNRNIKNLIRNTVLAVKVLRKEHPDLIISSGAAVSVPFFYLGKLFGAKLIYGGPASFIMPLQVGKVPVVVPRQKKYGEHVNDHQLEFAQEVEKRKKILF